ncbi:putative uncharacterized protein DDB_G0274435 isoform X1 [Chironomus tepperi]|uniref:putative uncharacterized protein DDB_G0274435 isoform X1 n=1 Tax=Chironomus tepperi TaxID=113505 RepID=UPI00391F06C9
MESSSALELLSRAALNAQEHEAAIELSKLPAKKRLSQLKAHQQQQNAILNSTPPTHSSISIIPINNQAVSAPINSSNNNNTIKSSLLDRPEMMEEDEEINVDGDHDDSPLDMRITKTKHDSDDSVRPSVIRRAPSFKDTNSNSPDPSSTCDPFIDEHFRRSLGTDYDLIMRNKQLEQEQKQRMLEEQLSLQQQQQQQAAVMHAQSLLKLKHHKKHQIHQHHQAMLNIQQENQLPIQPTPIQIVPQLQPQQQQKQVIITEHSDANEMSVDDHFAKALGDTWKKIQNESK